MLMSRPGLAAVRQIIFKQAYHRRFISGTPKWSSAVSTTVGSRRPFSLGAIKAIGKSLKYPAYFGGSVAAMGSYVTYKMEQAGNYTSDKFDQLRQFGQGLFDKFGSVGGDIAGASGSGGNGNNGGTGETVAAATLIAGLSDEEQEQESHRDEEDDEDGEEEDRTAEEMLNLTKQMIEIRSILNRVDGSGSSSINLPSIVVIGSQSSGKSSVLESVVGREFLPKGNNMVTRRPIELTLVNTGSDSLTADFPEQRIYNIKDFKEVKKLLFDLNMAVPSTEAVSEEPIQLTIKGKVPDLSLVDLPGYIQVEAADQPTELKSKIRQLCDKYLQAPNVILAISAADVDLANSSALKASRLADPTGERTIGVITKLDLVEPEVARNILLNKKYPLKMGYVGVITRQVVQPKMIFKKTTEGSFEKQYLSTNKKFFADCNVSTKRLREKLIKILEISMSASLEPTSRLIQQELDDTSYAFKVEFNDRQLTPKSYLMGQIDTLKLAVKEFNEKFNRTELKSILRADMDQRVLNLLAARYWKDLNLEELSTTNDSDLYWHKKLELTSSSLTKLGVGRISTTLVTNSILKELDNILNETKLRNHDLIKELVNNAAINVLNSKFYSTADQVENCIKPYKYEIDLEDRDWILAKEHSLKLMKEELRQCNDRFNMIKTAVGGRKLSQVMQFLDNNESAKETLGFSSMLIERGTEALMLQKRSLLLDFRIKALKSSKCSKKENKVACPEIFMNSVTDKLASTAVLFLNVELLSDFFYNFPIELDSKISQLNDEQIEVFAREDPKIARHIELQQRKELLELALEKIDSILIFKKSYKRQS